MRSFYGLRDAGVKDLGFAVTIQDDNAHDLLNLYRMVDDLDAEFAQAVPHNSYYFHTDENEIKDVAAVQDAIRGLMTAFLRSRKPEAVVPGVPQPRPRRLRRRGAAQARLHRRRRTSSSWTPGARSIPATAGTSAWGTCTTQDFAEIWDGARAREVREAVRTCDRRCWMTGTAVPAMKHNLPSVAWWVARNKVRVAAGLPIDLGD